MAKKKSKSRKAPTKKSKKIAKRAAPKKSATPKKGVRQSKPQSADLSRPRWISAGSNPVSALLIVRDVEAALDFCQTVFGFKVRGIMKDRNGSVLHAEMTYRESLIMFNPENENRGSIAPQNSSPVTLYVYVADVDAVADLARLNGGNVAQPPTDMFWGDRCSLIVDPDGHNWMIATHTKDIEMKDMKIPPAVN
jgi:PhnB protein